MGKRAELDIKESLEELTVFCKKQISLHLEKRVRALILIKLDNGLTRLEIANQLGVNKRTLERWVNRYTAEGLNKLVIDQQRRKGSKIITEEIHEGLLRRVHDPKNCFLGYWEAQNWIKEEYNVEVNYHRVREYLIQHFGTKVKSARKSHVNKDDKAVALFKNA